MKVYFKLQLQRINRILIEMGSRPVFAYPLGFLLFGGLSLLLFLKTEYAEYLYGILALSLVLKLSNNKRNEFLNYTFSKKRYRSIRVLENLITASPFVLFLLYKQAFTTTLILTSCSIILAYLNFRSPIHYTLPTPFSKTPFEFPVGFRKTFYIFPLAYYLTYQSVVSGNFNLGGASILLIGIVVLSYYSIPENSYYIWCFNKTSKDFIFNKIRIGLLLFTGLSLPIIIPLIIFFSDETTTLLFFILISYTYIITVILAKYSAYPYKINLTEGMLIGMSLMFMPLLVGIIPFLYLKSIRQLNPILAHD